MDKTETNTVKFLTKSVRKADLSYGRKEYERTMKMSTIALVIGRQSNLPVLMETLSDEAEIRYMEDALKAGETRPLQRIHEYRESEARQEDELGNHIEDLLSKTFVKPEIQTHAVQWLRSKIKIEQYQKAEKE